MIDLELYMDNSLCQKKSIIQILSNYGNFFQWNNDKEAIMDIGCGDGWVTNHILKPFLSSNQNKVTLHAVDVDMKLIHHARNKYEKSRIIFDVMDVTSEQDTDKFANNANKIFSFFCLQWCPDIRICLKNIHKMLKTQGTVFTILPCKNNTLSFIYNELISNKWKPYISEEVKQIMVKPLLQLDNPEVWLKTIFDQCQFNVIKCKLVQDDFTFSDFEQFKRFILMFPGMHKNIPQHLRDQFFEELKITAQAKLQSLIIPSDCILVIAVKK